MKAIIFDLGNTLVDYPLQTEDDQLKFLSKFVNENQLFLNKEKPDHQVTPFYNRFNFSEKIFCKAIFKTQKLMPDRIFVLNQLKIKYKIGLISNLPWGTSALYWRKEIINIFGENFFDSIIFCADVGFRKPHPKIFKASLTQLKINPDECVFVGDNYESDVIGAINSHIKPIWLTSNTNADVDTIFDFKELLRLC